MLLCKISKHLLSSLRQMPGNTELRKLKKFQLFRENDINIALSKQTIG